MTGRASEGVKVIVFDLGGVVVRICRSLKEAGERVGIAIPERIMAPEKRAERRALHAEYERGRIGCDAFFEKIAKTTEGACTAEQFRAIHEAWLIDEYAGVSALIDELHGTGLATGVLSNTNACHWEIMHRKSDARFPTLHKPRHKHASHLLGLAKPEPAIFKAFQERSGFAPSEIVFFDDLEANIGGAGAAGWHAHQIDHEGEPAVQMRGLLRDRHGIELGEKR